MDKITYTEVNGYLIPNLVYRSETDMEKVGKYGLMHQTYLKEHRKGRYSSLLLTDRIGKYLLEIDKAAQERMDTILSQLEKTDPLPDKEADQMAWVQAMNQHIAIAEEIILKELIYV